MNTEAIQCHDSVETENPSWLVERELLVCEAHLIHKPVCSACRKLKGVNSLSTDGHYSGHLAK